MRGIFFWRKLINHRASMFVLNEFRNDSRVIKEAKALAQQGFQVKVFALWGEGLVCEEEMEGFLVERIPLMTRHWSKSTFVQIFKYIEFMIRSIYRGMKWKSLFYHCHDLNTLPIGYIITRLGGGKLIYDSHELWSDPSHGKGMSRIFMKIGIGTERFLIRRSDAVITVCASIARHLAKLYDINEPFIIRNIPEEVETARNDLFHQEFDIDQEEPILLYQGNIAAGRGLKNLLEAMADVSPGTLVLMGDGPLKESLKKAAAEKGLGSRVYFKDAVPPAEVLKYTASADIGVSPIENICLSYYYCLPNKLFEYIMAGIPVAASNFPEMESIVAQNGIGRTFDPSNVREIADVLNEMVNNALSYQYFKKNMDKMKGMYTWKKESKVLLELYEREL